jgi:hypothetical protein
MHKMLSIVMLRQLQRSATEHSFTCLYTCIRNVLTYNLLIVLAQNANQIANLKKDLAYRPNIGAFFNCSSFISLILHY